MFNQFLKFRQKFMRDENGAMAVIIAIVFIPLMLSVGLSIDLGRAYMVKQRLAYALDAAGLAVGSTAVDANADLNAMFQRYMDANFAASDLGTPQNLLFSYADGVINVSGEAVVEMTVMRIVGIDSLTVSASGQMLMATSGLELILALDNTGSMSSNNKLTTLKSSAHDMIDILFGNETAPDTIRVGLVPFSGSVNIGTSKSVFVNDTSVYDWGTTSWDGCVMARGGGEDQDDSNSTLWDPFYWSDHNWYNNWINWYGYSIDSSPPSTKGPNKYCPLEVTPLTNNRATLESEIDNMWASGYTHINLGAVWAWRLISPDAPFTEGVAYSDPDWNKAVIILTDGQNTTSNSVYTAYQYRSDGVLGSTSSSGTSDELDNRLTAVCDNMKAEGIIVYTITFQLSDPDTQAIFSACATDTNKYFNSPNNSDLQSAFRTIGAELRNLHISQ